MTDPAPADETPRLDKIRMPRSKRSPRRTERQLPEGALPCRDCGVAVRNPSPSSRITLASDLAGRAAESRGPGRQVIELDFTTCLACSARRARAEHFAEEHTAFARRLGDRRYAATVVDSALAALDALGVSPRDIERLTGDLEGMKAAIHFLAKFGADARWVSRFVPYMRKGASINTAFGTRWEHVPDDVAQQLRDSYAEMLYRRTASPTRVAPPDGAACRFCGVGGVWGHPRDVKVLWGEERKFQPLAFGVKLSEPIHGYLCPTCRRGLESAGAMGRTAVEHAVLAYLGHDLTILGPAVIEGLHPWLAKRAGAKSNAEPWEHDKAVVEGVREDLKNVRQPLRFVGTR